MSFINPFLLIGVLAVGIPLLIHLWSKRQAKVMDFSLVRFLMSLERKRMKRLKLRQILILILRMLIVALIAMALARPILTDKWAFAAGGRAKSSVVIVLDNSYSMGYEQFDSSRFDMAKSRALDVLDSLRTGDNASLILMSDSPDVVFKQLTSNVQQVKETIRNARTSHKGTYVWPSVAEAYKLLEASDHPYKAIYLISDLGENGWKDWRDIPHAVEMVDVFVIKTGEPEVSNASVKSIALSDEPAGMEMPVNISAEIESSGGDEATLELFVDGEKKAQTTADKGSISFSHVFEHPGTHVGEVRLTSDGLMLDDVRYFAINVLGQIRALSVGDYKSYINLALNPVISLNPEAEFSILPAGCAAEELEHISTDQYNVIILTDIPQLSEEATGKLKNFVLSGGSLVIFVGQDANRDWYNNQFSLTPATLEERSSFPMSPLRLSEWDKDHPMFRVFRDKSMKDALASPQFYSAFPMKPHSTAKIIASFDRNIPAIVEDRLGQGRILMFNCSPDTRNSDLPLDPVFLPLMQQMAFYLASEIERSDKNILVGDTYQLYVKGVIDSPPEILSPDGNIIKPALVADEQGNQIRYESVERSGIYKLEFKSEGVLRRDYFAVNIDTEGESRLKAAKDSEIKSKLGERARILALDDSPQEIVMSTGGGRELSSRLLIAALILMMVEIILANRRRLGDKIQSEFGGQNQNS